MNYRESIKNIRDTFGEFEYDEEILSILDDFANDEFENMKDLSGTHKYFKDTELQAQISQNSVDVIRNLFLENQVKEVTIRISEKGELKVALKSWVDLAAEMVTYNILKKPNY